VTEANRAVNDRARKTRTDMGTTCVAALVIGSDAFIANVGDSRCYHISGGQIKQVSVDHSLVQRFVDAGQITQEEARVHPQKNYIYRTIGDKPQVEVDLFPVSLRPGDFLVLCSDGLSGMIEDAQIHRSVADAAHPQAACERLVQLANLNGGDDNVTTIVVAASQAKGNR
jgi:serine/threonine protein phosphatase PrpC